MPTSTTSISVNLDFSREIIEREKLGALVNLMKKKKFILCKAPAGYGKSVGLKQATDALCHQQQQCILVDYEVNHGDTHFLATSLLTYLEGKVPNDEEIRSIEESSATGVRLRRSLNQLETKLFIVIDNYHLSPSSADTQLLQQLIHLPGQELHICLGSRYEPGFNYRKLLLDGRAIVVGQDRFSFSTAETKTLLSKSISTQATKSSAIDKVQQITEGWPVGIRIALHLLKTGVSSDNVEAELEKHHLISSYFEEEVIAGISPRLKQAACELALFEEFSPALLNDGCQISDAELSIEKLRDSNLFISTNEGEHRVYKFHPLFRYFLRNCRWHPSATRQELLYSKAGVWSENNKLNIQAIEYYLLAGRIEDAKHLISRSAHTIVRDQGLPPKLIQWCEKIPPGNASTAIYMNYWLAFSLTFSRRSAEAEKKIKDLQKTISFTKIIDKNEKHQLKGQLWCLRIVLQVFKEQADWCFKETDSWLKQYKDTADPYDVSVIYSARHDSARLLLNAKEARFSIIKAKESVAGMQSPYASMWLEMLDGLCEMEFGNFQVAHRILRDAHKASLKQEGQTSPIASTISLLLARSFYESGNIHEAERLLSEGFQHIHDHGLTESAVIGVYLSYKLATQDSRDEALYQLKKVESMAGRHSERLSFMIRRFRTSLLLQSGQIEAAEAEAQLAGVEIKNGHILSITGALCPVMEDEQIRLGIDLLYAQGRYKAAMTNLKQLLARNHTPQRPKFHVECIIIQSALLTMTQEKQAAGRQMSKALKIAHENGLFQTLLDLSPYCELALKELVKKRKNWGMLPEDALLERLCDQLGYSPKIVPDSDLGEIDFSERELELLGLLSSPLSIQDIADYVFLSKATVKWHLHNIYKKLRVKNRTGAIAAAQEKGYV